jgi:glycosidase
MLFSLFEKGFLKKEEQTWAEGMIQLYDHFSNDFLFSDTNNLLVFAENHDTQRINFLYPNLKDYQLAMTILATVRGIPQIYYGSEIGMTGSKDKGDGDIRREFPGGWPDHAQNAFDQNTRTAEQKAYHSFTKKVFQWRKNAKAIHHGKTTHYLPQNNVYVYFRHTEQESVMVVINNSNQKQEISLDRFEENLKEFSEGTDILNNQSFEIINNEALTSIITIEPKSSKIIELKK